MMIRRSPRPVVLAVSGRRRGYVARGEGGNGEELGRWEGPQATRGGLGSRGCCTGGERRWQRRSRRGSRAPEEEAGRCQGDLFAILENSKDFSAKIKIPVDTKS
jgi:hypothetical protein